MLMSKAKVQDKKRRR